MAIRRVYLDHNATSPVRPEAFDAVRAAAGQAGNPSSVHAEGRRGRATVETARARVAALVQARPDQVFFTSGATEAANAVLRPGAGVAGRSLDRLVVCATEHPAVLLGHGFERERVDVVPVGPDGVIDLGRLAATLARAPGAIVAVQAANNETGVLQPLAAIRALARAADGLVVCDAVQAAGRIPCDQTALPADVVLLSSHKLGGLPGSGAVVVRNQGVSLPPPLLRGGGQERGQRAGTENVPAIAAFGVAADEASREVDGALTRTLRDRFEAELAGLAPDAVVFGAGARRLPNTSAFAIPGIAAETLVMALDLAGVSISSGSACASGKVGRSHVLEAMGVEPDLRRGAVRVSFGWNSTAQDVIMLVEALASVLDRIGTRTLSTAA